MADDDDDHHHHYHHNFLKNPRFPFYLMVMVCAALLVYHFIAICFCSGRRRPPPPGISNSSSTSTSSAITEPSNAPVVARPLKIGNNIIRAHRYRKGTSRGGGRVEDDGTCAVCLGEFEEGEELRTLPECLHSFHVSCIDVWLISHPNCPICRANYRFSPH